MMSKVLFLSVAMYVASIIWISSKFMSKYPSTVPPFIRYTPKANISTEGPSKFPSRIA